MKIDLPHAPFFVRPPVDDNGGVDFLGLRQANLNLMDTFLPGVNNVTWNVRPYSMMAWTVWAFANEARERGMTEIKASDFTKFREKVEVLFNWGHQLDDNGAGMPGNAQVPPAGAGEVPLDFASWKRNVTWFDAVNYGPSIKDENGLGFVHQVESGLFRPTEAGEALAKALDETLRATQEYETLESLETGRATEAVAQRLYGAWRIDECSAREATIFKDVLYQADASDESARVQRRSGAISLIQESLSEIGRPLRADEIRAEMMRTTTQSRRSLPVARAKAVWTVLQIRQAQRLAFEALFAWMEMRILVQGDASSQQLVGALVALLTAQGYDLGRQDWVSACLATSMQGATIEGSIVDIGLNDDGVGILAQTNELANDIPDHRDDSAVRAVMLLFLVAAVTEELEKAEEYAELLNEGGSQRVSLRWWSRFVKGKGGLPAPQFLTNAFENYLLSQHFGIAAIRTSESKPRLRITIEEEGLVSLLKKDADIWQPGVTADRLESTLSLMADCGLLNRMWDDGEEQWRYSP